MFIVIGFLSLVVTVVAYLNPRIRLVEDELPDVVADETLDDRTAQKTAEVLEVAGVPASSD